MRQPLNLQAPRDRDALIATLVAFGTAILRGVCDPNVLAVYRLAIAESDSSPEVARTLDQAGREANRVALVELLTAAQVNGLLGAGEPATMAARFVSLLWGDLLVRLLLRVTNMPKPMDMEQRARTATEIVLALYPARVDERKSG
jgi:TetR/AcrR family transcriptional regulator, mexJK operon transcriptional repressor